MKNTNYQIRYRDTYTNRHVILTVNVAASAPEKALKAAQQNYRKSTGRRTSWWKFESMVDQGSVIIGV